jgi:3-methyl-2-oxobutanoate hydroxymethyltransferase
MKETGAHAVKLEGGKAIIPAVERIVSAGIPVMGHLGLTPQSIYRFGTYRVRAREVEEAAQLKLDAKLLEEAGCFAIVIEKIPGTLATDVARSLKIPTIGIGAGPGCDGQVLVTHDMLGLTTEFNPRFVRRYAELAEQMTLAVQTYVKDVKSNAFPSDAETYE